jgi:hypothetical protein
MHHLSLKAMIESLQGIVDAGSAFKWPMKNVK